jgi:hypothetical protein
MAIELQVVSVTALVTGEPPERQVYEGRGDDRKVKGRVVDVAGRPLSAVTAVVLADPIPVHAATSSTSANRSSRSRARSYTRSSSASLNGKAALVGAAGDPGS